MGREMRNLGRCIAGALVVGTMVGPFGSPAKAVEHPEGQVVERPVFEDPATLVVEFIFSPGASLGRHAHFFPAVIHVLSGAFTVVFGDGDRRPLTSGEVLILPARRVHTWSNDGIVPCRVRLIILKTPRQPRGV